MISSFPAIVLFYSVLFISTLMSVSAPHWVLAWLGMELNMMVFIPMMCMNKSGQSAEASSKYFLAQTTGSALFLFAPTVWFTSLSVLANGGLLVGLLTKVGSAPMHQWFPATAAGLSWSMVFLLMTWQKVGPLMLVFTLVRPTVFFFSLFAVMSVFLGGLGGLNQTQMRPLMAYSSIAHMGWMLVLIPLSVSGAISYLMVYVMISVPIFLILGVMEFQSVKVASMFQLMLPTLFFFFSLLILSMAGMPPFSGFFMKAYAVAVMVESGFFLVPLFFVLCATMSLAFYINVLFLSVLGSMYLGNINNFVLPVFPILFGVFMGFGVLPFLVAMAVI